jgi:poly(glycerol-phosphate) alpha-glucosyltransferase
MLDPWALQNSGWKKRLAARVFENANIRTAACLHALTASEAKSIRAYGFPGPICVIPNGVGLPAPDEPPPALPWWKHIEPDKKTILYLGRIHPKKGLANLVGAWRCIEPGLRDDWRLIIAGWEEHGHQVYLQRLALSLGVQITITFPGPLFGDDMKAAFRHCDGFILPSVSEGLPMAVLEAWAYGKPVIMTPQCNLPEGFEAGAALCVEPEKESILGGLTGFMRMDDAKRRSIGLIGRALAEQRFAWPSVVAQMAAVYRWVAGRAPQPASVQPAPVATQ